MRRSVRQPRELHPIYRSLLDTDLQENLGKDQIAYQAQDFWVYAGKARGLGIGYLKGLFALGGNVDAADQFFQQQFQSSLGSEYWAWVKNQAIEKTETFEGALTDPCHIVNDDPVVGPVSGLTYPSPEGPSSVGGTLGRLTAVVVKVEIKANVLRTTITAGRPDGLAYKVYVDGDADCAKIDDAHPEFERKFESLAAGTAIYVVLANVKHQAGERVAYQLEVKPTEAAPQ